MVNEQLRYISKADVARSTLARHLAEVSGNYKLKE